MIQKNVLHSLNLETKRQISLKYLISINISNKFTEVIVIKTFKYKNTVHYLRQIELSIITHVKLPNVRYGNVM